MSLAATLASLCPSPLCSADDQDRRLALVPRDGVPVLCHDGLLRARCRALPDGDVVEVQEDSSVLHALLRWVYCGTVDREITGVGNHAVGARVVRLGRLWGLHDADCLQGRVAARRLAAHGTGTLAEDLLSAYERGALNGRFMIRPNDEVPRQEDAAGAPPLHGGWCALLRGRSSYFGAMLSGAWAETSGPDAAQVVLDVCWPRDQMARLLRFLHGGEFIEGPDDLRPAIECAKFFGVPSLFASANDWISANLRAPDAPALWNFVESEPMLSLYDGGEHEDAADADAACFDFHIQNFAELAEEVKSEDVKAQVPLHQLNPSLMQRLLASGLVDMPTASLKVLVKTFAKAHTGDRRSSAYRELCAQLRPPRVLFNREHRSFLMPQGEVTARTFV